MLIHKKEPHNAESRCASATSRALEAVAAPTDTTSISGDATPTSYLNESANVSLKSKARAHVANTDNSGSTNSIANINAT